MLADVVESETRLDGSGHCHSQTGRWQHHFGVSLPACISIKRRAAPRVLTVRKISLEREVLLLFSGSTECTGKQQERIQADRLRRSAGIGHSSSDKMFRSAAIAKRVAFVSTRCKRKGKT